MRSKIAPKNIIPAIIMAFLNMGSDNNNELSIFFHKWLSIVNYCYMLHLLHNFYT